MVEIGLLAFHTLTVSGGTVTFTEPSAAGLTALSVPKTGVKTAPLPLVQVGKVAVAAMVSLLAATTYSTWPLPSSPWRPSAGLLPCLRSSSWVAALIREVAKMPAPVEA